VIRLDDLNGLQPSLETDDLECFIQDLVNVDGFLHVARLTHDREHARRDALAPRNLLVDDREIVREEFRVVRPWRTRFRSPSEHPAMDASGLLISWAMPDAIWPSDASRSDMMSRISFSRSLVISRAIWMVPRSSESGKA